MNIISSIEIKMLSESLKPYIEFPMFNELFMLISNNMKKDNSDKKKIYQIRKCCQCGKYFVVNKLEIINKHLDSFRDDISSDRDWKNPNLCRNCGKWSFDSIIDVKLGQNIPQILYDYYILDKSLNKECLTKVEAEKIILLTGSAEYVDILFVHENYRRYINKLLYPNREYVTEIFYETVNISMNNGREEFFTCINNLSKENDIKNKIRHQRTSDINITLNKLKELYRNGIFNILYPRLYHKSKANYISLEEVKFENAKEYLNLYKDLFDLLYDHTIINYICCKFKNPDYKFNENQITDNLYGKNLLKVTIKNAKNTPMEQIINQAYNLKMRNGIAHGSYIIERKSRNIIFYSNGNISYEDSWKNILMKIETLVSLHKEIDNFSRYFLVLYEEKYLLTSGIYCIQPEIGTDGAEIHITQASPFWKKSIVSGIPLHEIYKIHLQKIIEGFEKGIQLRIDKEVKSKYINTYYKETKLQCIGFIKQWVQKVIESGKINVLLIQINQQIDFGEEGGSGIEYKIPIDMLNEERMMITGLYNYIYTYNVTEDVRMQLQELISSTEK